MEGSLYSQMFKKWRDPCTRTNRWRWRRRWVAVSNFVLYLLVCMCIWHQLLFNVQLKKLLDFWQFFRIIPSEFLDIIVNTFSLLVNMWLYVCICLSHWRFLHVLLFSHFVMIYNMPMTMSIQFFCFDEMFSGVMVLYTARLRNVFAWLHYVFMWWKF